MEGDCSRALKQISLLKTARNLFNQNPSMLKRVKVFLNINFGRKANHSGSLTTSSSLEDYQNRREFSNA